MNSFLKFKLILISAIFLASSSFAQEPVTGAKARLSSWKKHKELKEKSSFKNLEWRVAGPEFMSGRIETIACHPNDPFTIYIGAGSGSLWKTDNHGTSWKPIFDDQPTFAMGCVA